MGESPHTGMYLKVLIAADRWRNARRLLLEAANDGTLTMVHWNTLAKMESELVAVMAEVDVYAEENIPPREVRNEKG